MGKGMYSRMIFNLQFYGKSQDLQYIHAVIMDPEFGLTEDIMTQMVGNTSQMIKMSKGDTETPTWNESTIGA